MANETSYASGDVRRNGQGGDEGALYSSLNEAQQTILHGLAYRPRVQALVDHAADKLYGGLHILHESWTKYQLATIYHYSPQFIEGTFVEAIAEKRLRVDLREYLTDLRRLADVRRDLSSRHALLPPETLTELIAADIPKPIQLFEGLMHEGMLLFGGKSKRGKSWLMFDLAIALAVGRSAFRHYSCVEPRPVLYLALEDGRARLQGRAKAIQPNLTTADNFHLRYTFPSLTDGGIALLAEEIKRHQYGLVIIDVLAKLERPSNGKQDKGYHDIYDLFAPIQELRKQFPFCLTMLTHLRKQEADDVFDTLMGSVAYQGAQDVLWVLERKPKDDFAFLHIRDKDAEEKTSVVRFLDGHWEYVGEGEEYEVSRDQRKVIKVLIEEKREMTIPEIMKSCDFPEAKYGYIRKLLVTMVKDDLIHRTRYGKYSYTIRGEAEMGDIEEEEAIDEIHL